MIFVRFLFALGAALAAAVALELIFFWLMMLPIYFGIDLSKWSLSFQHCLIFSSQTMVAFGGILAAGYFAGSVSRVKICWIITAICLGIALFLLHLIPKGHHLPGPTWLDSLENPFLWCYALGGAAASLYFTLRRDRTPHRPAAGKPC